MEYLDETKDMHTCSDLFISYKTCSQVTSWFPFRWLKSASLSWIDSTMNTAFHFEGLQMQWLSHPRYQWRILWTMLTERLPNHSPHVCSPTMTCYSIIIIFLVMLKRLLKNCMHIVFWIYHNLLIFIWVEIK